MAFGNVQRDMSAVWYVMGVCSILWCMVDVLIVCGNVQRQDMGGAWYVTGVYILRCMGGVWMVYGTVPRQRASTQKSVPTTSGKECWSCSSDF